MNPAAKQYIRQVKKHLHCPRSLKNEFLQQLGDEIFLYCEENDLADFDDLARHFGAPETVAKEFLSELDGETISKYYSHRGRLALIAAGCLAVFLVGVGIRQVYVQNLFLDTHYVESITYESDSLPDITGPTYYHEEGSSDGTRVIYGIETFSSEE